MLHATDSQEASAPSAPAESQAPSAPAESQGPKTPARKLPFWGNRTIKAGRTTFADTIEASQTLEQQLESELARPEGPIEVGDSPKQSMAHEDTPTQVVDPYVYGYTPFFASIDFERLVARSLGICSGLC